MYAVPRFGPLRTTGGSQEARVPLYVDIVNALIEDMFVELGEELVGKLKTAVEDGVGLFLTRCSGRGLGCRGTGSR